VVKDTLANVKKIAIEGDCITLGQFLKFARIIEQGGMAKSFLLSRDVMVGGIKETRRGRKLRPGDVVQIGSDSYDIASQ
jgi:ribosome-associated protein YbcJ (S4-like RNA binding protein)